MNKDQIEGKFEQLKGHIKSAWGKLTDDEIAQVKGERDKFFGKVQEKYGIAKNEAEKQLKKWEDTCGYCSDKDAA